MTIVRCDKDCIYNEAGGCTADMLWITETGECDVDNYISTEDSRVVIPEAGKEKV